MPARFLSGQKLTSCRCPDELEDVSFLCHALGNDRLEGSKLEAVLSPQIDAFAHKDRGPKLLVQAFEARRQIHRIAKGRVVHALSRPKIADDSLSDVNAEPREEWLETLIFKLGVELLTRRSARKGRPAGPFDVIRLWVGCVPEHHHRVTNELVDCSAFGEESLC